MKNICSNIILGSAQFGLDYGISNVQGKTSVYEVGEILKLAADHGVDCIDTARVYGESESVIGQIPLARKFNLITKVPAINVGSNIKLHIENSLRTSLRLLKRDSLQGVLIHNPKDLLGDDADSIYEELVLFKRRGEIENIGVSVYSPNEAELIVSRYDLDLIQLPFNIFDQRFANSGTLQTIKRRNVEIHARSAFLQGVLLMDVLPAGFERAEQVHKEFSKRCLDLNVSKLKSCLGYVLMQSSIDKIVLGINNSLQLKEVLENLIEDNRLGSFQDFSIDDETILNPSLWGMR